MKYTYPLILLMSILVVPVASVCADDVAQKLDGPEVHSLHELLEVTAQREKEIRKTVHGYTCLIAKRERINGVLQRQRFIRAKVRQDIAADPDGTNTQLKIAHSARINDRKCTAIVVTHLNPG